MAKTPVKPLLFQPAPRWHLWLALGGAVAIHLTAVALAQKREVVAAEPPPQPPMVVEATLAPPEATPPPEDIPLPEPPPPPEVQPEFHEERTPPPRPPPAAQKFTPIKAQAMTMSRAKALAINSPRPQYPYEARSRHITGSGVCVVTVDPGSGNVTGATMTQSIGNPILDNAALSAFREWRFRPGTVSQVRIPITFTMTGAAY
ncbi:MAG TPA: TonB family protein [Candidatus Udaeobacter sp.]|jgi:TonB family protein